MTPPQSIEELMAKTLDFRHVHEEQALNDIIFEAHDASIQDSMREYWANRMDANQHDLATHTTSLHLLYGHDVTSRQTKPTEPKPENQRGKTWSSPNSCINSVMRRSTSSPPASTRSISSTPVLAMNHAAPQSSPSSSNAFSLLATIIGALSTIYSTAYCVVCLSKNRKTSQYTFLPEESKGIYPLPQRQL